MSFRRVAYKTKTAAKTPTTPAIVMPRRTFSEAAADLEVPAVGLGEEADPVDEPPAGLGVLTAPAPAPVPVPEADAPFPDSPFPDEAVVGAGVGIATAVERRQLRWQVS